MFDGILSVVNVLLAVAGPLAAADSTGLTWALVAIAATVAITALLPATAAGDGDMPGAHPWRAIDASSPLSQSDPDAEGHPRPRAPASAASAA
jgi:hypothetical protein